MAWIEPILRTWLHLIVGVCLLMIIGTFIQHAIQLWNDRIDMRELDIDSERLQRSINEVRETLNKYQDMR